MSKVFIITLSVVACCLASELRLGSNKARLGDSEWLSYKAQHGKTYASQFEEMTRRKIYEQRKLAIEKFNAEQSEQLGFKRGLNHLSDRTEGEIRQLLGFHVPEDIRLENDAQSQTYLDKLLNSTDPVPDSLDWRETPNVVSAVKNQGECSSCWAFSAVGALEGQQHKIGIKKQVPLSEQNVIDCDQNSYGCAGGIMSTAFEAIKAEGGIESEVDYPYTARNGQCSFKKDKSVMTDKGYAILKEGDEEELKKVVATFGPVSVGIDATKVFHDYSEGILNDYSCDSSSQHLNHGVLVVGYGTDPKKGDYWIVKNSWSEFWGQKGYVYLARNAGNMCGIATFAIIPTI